MVNNDDKPNLVPIARDLAELGFKLVATGGTAPPGPAGGRPAALYRFAERGIRVTDQFAVLRPPDLRQTELRPVERRIVDEPFQSADPSASS